MQSLGGAAASGEQGVHDGVDGEQADGRGDALAHLTDRHGEQCAPVGLPRHVQGGADERGHGAQRGRHGQVQARVLVLRPAQVVAQRSAEQLLFGVGDPRLGHLHRSEEPLHGVPPEVGQFSARYDGPWMSMWKMAAV